MKSGLTIDELSAEVLRQNQSKQDYLVKTSNLQMESFGGSPLLRLIDDNDVDLVEPLDIKPTAHRQISTYLDIPAKYYSLLGQQRVIEQQQFLSRHFIPGLGRKEQFFEVHSLSPRILFCTFWSAR